MIVHLIDGTYELFRHFYGLRRFNKGDDAPYGAVIGVLNTVLETIEQGATHIGVATDHVIESFRKHGIIENFPPTVLGENRDQALLFKNLATLRTDAPLFENVDALRWLGPADTFAACEGQLGSRLIERCSNASVA